MGKFICLHSSDKAGNKIWLNADAIIVVADRRPSYSYTAVVVQNLEYHVQETAGSVIGLIEQKTNPLDNYVCPAPVPVNLARARAEEEKKNE